ncbi:hypothetical protein RRR77_000714 [Klebsiella aerogenes]|uniref:hypothetical protein n=1 Tax=Klebsiella aerogenes TaxID=548 RepID=UPI000B40C4A4|nr:hypothetical protein [Klebsiella aerogenes]ELJ2005804.1 hypothetical protein [Klebsiella aerogenes]RNT21763.1 hypothetical protein B9031_023660 [Klebsiella aerogenes]
MNNENELTAALLTIEKCRELSGCPAGVDLQDWVKMLVSELSVVEEIHNSAVFITDELYDASPKEVQGIIRSLACMKMPAYARLVAGIKADGRVEGAHFVANRMLAAWDAGFIEDSAKNAADIARMILTSTEFMADAPEGDFDRSFADGILEDIAKQLREGADK